MDIFEVFYQEKNDDLAPAMEAYMRNKFEFLGIKSSKRRELSREFFKENPKIDLDWDFVDKAWSLPEREFQYLALDYLQKFKKKLSFDDISRLKNLALSKSWWDTIDVLDKIIGDLALRYPQTNEILLAWSKDNNFWLRRIAIDHQRGRKNKTDTGLMNDILVNNLNQKEFFINKAIGWALRDYSKTNPQWVTDFINTHRQNMAPLSIKEGSKYI